MTEQRWFPIQAGYSTTTAPPHPLRIPWSVAEKAYCAYARLYGTQQSLERLAERGGFGGGEMDELYPAWRDETSEIVALRDKIAAYEASHGLMLHNLQSTRSQLASTETDLKTMTEALVKIRTAAHPDGISESGYENPLRDLGLIHEIADVALTRHEQ